MAADLAHRSYVSSKLLDTFLKGTPEVTQKHVEDLRGKSGWTAFMASYTSGKTGNSSTHNSSGSNENEFKALLQCIASLEGLRKRNDSGAPPWQHPLSPTPPWHNTPRWLSCSRARTQTIVPTLHPPHRNSSFYDAYERYTYGIVSVRSTPMRDVRVYEMAAYERHVYEVVSVRSTSMRDAPMRDTSMRWSL